MGHGNEARKVIEGVRKEIEASKGTRIWGDYINALKLIAQVIFTRSSGFIFELIQNAEDAGLGLDNLGVFEILINHHRVKVVHNGRQFTSDDVKALCGIMSSKKPEKGTLGYLGIGFKSVFKITDCPEVYSGEFQFKFDRNHKEWGDPSHTPWHVLPILIDEPSENIDRDKTTFIIPFREETYYASLIEEVAKLRTELYLFLRWLRTIKVTDEVSRATWILENMGEDDEGTVTLKHDVQEQRFKFFRHTCPVPNWVKQDRLTQEYRANVTQREIAVAFAVDENGSLAPSLAGAMYGGVYSFLPLGEARSGAKFPIQADFLVQPGREAINYEASWNQWLMDEVAILCKEAIQYFKKHDTWKYQFLEAFGFTKTKGLESYDYLFGPRLIQPIEKYLEDDECVPTTDGGWTKPAKGVKLTEDQEASEALVSMGILTMNEIAVAFGGEPDLKLVDLSVQESSTMPLKKVDRLDFLANEAFLSLKAKESNAPKWFWLLYMWLHTYPRWNYSKRGNRSQEGYWSYKIVLTSGANLLEGRDVWFPDFNPSDPILKDLTNTLQKSKQVLHPSIILNAKDEEEQKAIRGFLMGLTGMQALDSKSVCRDALLPKILTSSPKPLPNDLLKYTTYCQQILGNEIEKGLEFWVLTKQGDIRSAKETLLPKEYNPEQEWETHQQYVPGITFVSKDYLSGTTAIEELKRWREFLEAGGVKKNPDNGVEVFAENYAMDKLQSNYVNVTKVDKLNFGYDIRAETKNGEEVCFEVKGQSQDHDVELTGNELDSADIHKDFFYLCVISSVPESPSIYLVNNPSAPGVGKKDKLTIPLNVWKAAKWT